MSFFLGRIIPYLGPAEQMATTNPWKSFMTDDGTPIEFSWDWTTRTTPPKIRYSIEPCDYPGLSMNSSNTSAVQSFCNIILKNSPGVNFAWYDHFTTLIGERRAPDNKVDSLPNSIFYAFDLIDQGMMAKAYYILRSEKEVIGRVD